MNKERLTKISLKITPKQAAVICMKECQRFDSLSDYLDHLVSLPLEVWPEVKTREQIKESVRLVTKGNGEQSEQATRQAEREITFLQSLQFNTNTMVLNEVERYELLARLLKGQVTSLVYMKTSPLAKADDIAEQAVTLKIIISSLLMETYGTRGVVEVISKKYFDSHPVLYPEVKRLLDAKIEMLEFIVSHFNEVIEPCRIESKFFNDLIRIEPSLFRSGLMIELEEVLSMISGIITKQITELVEEAKIHTLIKAGNGAEARKIWDQRVARTKKEKQEWEIELEQM